MLFAQTLLVAAAVRVDFSAAASVQLSAALARWGVDGFDDVRCEQRLAWPFGTECLADGGSLFAADERAQALQGALDAAGALAARADGSGIHVVAVAARNLRCAADACTGDVEPPLVDTVADADARRLFELMGLAGVPGGPTRRARHVSSAFSASLPGAGDGVGGFDLLYLLDSGEVLRSADRELSLETRELLTRLGANKVYVEDDSDVFAHDLVCAARDGAYNCRFTVAAGEN